jgi:hypothetical protein
VGVDDSVVEDGNAGEDVLELGCDFVIDEVRSAGALNVRDVDRTGSTVWGLWKLIARALG